MENFSVCHSDARPEVKGEKTLVLFFSMKKCSDQNDHVATLMLDQPYILILRKTPVSVKLNSGRNTRLIFLEAFQNGSTRNLPF